MTSDGGHSCDTRYKKEKRRAIEAALFSGELRAVVATNALELGVDVGSLDATLHLGWPGSTASLAQQAGRAGRSGRPSFAVLVAQDNPLEQHLVECPDQILSRPLERTVIHPANATLLRHHIVSAARETPIRLPARSPGAEGAEGGAGGGGAEREACEQSSQRAEQCAEPGASEAGGEAWGAPILAPALGEAPSSGAAVQLGSLLGISEGCAIEAEPEPELGDWADRAPPAAKAVVAGELRRSTAGGVGAGARGAASGRASREELRAVGGGGAISLREIDPCTIRLIVCRGKPPVEVEEIETMDRAAALLRVCAEVT